MSVEKEKKAAKHGQAVDEPDADHSGTWDVSVANPSASDPGRRALSINEPEFLGRKLFTLFLDLDTRHLPSFSFFFSCFHPTAGMESGELKR